MQKEPRASARADIPKHRRAAQILAVAAAVFAQPWIAFAADATDTTHAAGRATRILAATLILCIIVLTGLAMIRSLRRMRETLLQKPPRPTDATDVWPMHKLPPGAEKEIEDEEE